MLSQSVRRILNGLDAKEMCSVQLRSVISTLGANELRQLGREILKRNPASELVHVVRAQLEAHGQKGEEHAGVRSSIAVGR